MAQPLATIDDLLARLGRTITDDQRPRVIALLVDASAAVRRYTDQQFTEDTTTLRAKVTNGVVILPQRPVTAVASVFDTNANEVEFTWEGGDRVTVATNVPDSWAWVPWANGITAVDITYTHGYAEIPEDIVAVVCQVAGRAMGRPPEDSGMTSETIAGYSYTIGVTGAAGPVGLLPDEKAVLDDYRRRYGTARMG